MCVHCCVISLFTEMLKKCQGDLLEMKEGKLKTRPTLLENLIFFVEVRILWRHTLTVFFSTAAVNDSLTLTGDLALCRRCA